MVFVFVMSKLTIRSGVGSIKRQEWAVLFEPGTGFLIVWIEPCDFSPKGLTMVGDFEMSKLVDDDIFNHGQWRHAQAIGEVEVALP